MDSPRLCYRSYTGRTRSHRRKNCYPTESARNAHRLSMETHIRTCYWEGWGTERVEEMAARLEPRCRPEENPVRSTLRTGSRSPAVYEWPGRSNWQGNHSI